MTDAIQALRRKWQLGPLALSGRAGGFAALFASMCALQAVCMNGALE